MTGKTRKQTRGLKNKIKTQKKRTGLIVIQKAGDLKKYGYENIVSLTKEEREIALRKAVKAYGSLAVLRKVNAIRVLTKRTNPKLSEVLGKDVVFLQEIHKNS